MDKKYKDFVQHLEHDLGDEDIADDYLHDTLPLIGWVVTCFNALERTIDMLICESISDRSDSMGLLVINGMQYKSKVDLFKRISDDFQRSLGQIAPSYVGLIDKLHEVGRIRNSIVHADWLNTDEDGYTFTKVKISINGMRQEYLQFSVDSLNKFIDEINELAHQLSDYSEERSSFLEAGYHGTLVK